MNLNWKPIKKIVATALGGLTTTGVMAFLAEIGHDIPQAWAAAIVTLAAALAGYLMPDKRADTKR